MLDTKYTDRYIFLMTSKPTGKSLETKQFIIQTAAPIFNKKGVSGTSLSDLTTATGLTKGSIYGNFRNKDDLAIAVYEYNVAALTRFFAREMKNAGTCIEKLRVYPRAYQKLFKAMTSFGGCPILNTATEADDTHDVLCRMAADTITRWKNEIVSLIEDGIATAEIKPGTDAERMADIMLSLFEGGGILAKVTGRKSVLDHCLDQMEQMIDAIKVPA